MTETDPRVSNSIAKATAKNALEPDGPSEQDVNMVLDTYALAADIAKNWQVSDADLVVLQFGGSAVAAAHRRMLYMSRQQKLTGVRSLEDYFMSVLIGNRRPQDPGDDRSLDAYEARLEELRATPGTREYELASRYQAVRERTKNDET